MRDVSVSNAALSSDGRSDANKLFPLVCIIFLGFLAIGIPLPVIALHVYEKLGYSTVVVGWVIGLQSLVTVLSRHRAGTLSDERGPRLAVLVGLALAAASGALYYLSAWAPTGPVVRLVILLAGRVVLGIGESLFITGAMTWGICRLGPTRTGKVMSWQGIAMYGALGLGAPLGLAVNASYGFEGVAALTIVAPLMGFAIALGLTGVPASHGQRVPFHRVLGLIWRPGLVLTLSTIPFAAMATFLALDFAARKWAGAGFALAAFGFGYVLVRFVASHLPDRFGGVKVAAGSLVIEALGQSLLWLAPVPEVGVVGAALTGIGFSLIFPSMGVEATRRVAPEFRGRAVGNFIAFFDVSVGLTGPVVGLSAEHFGYPSAFLVGMVAAVAALALVPMVGRMSATAQEAQK